MYNQPEEALAEYDLVINSITKGRNSYICDTDKGQKLLIPYTGSEEKIKQQHSFLEDIKKNGLEVEQITKTVEGNLKSKDNSGIEYILKDYYPGTECRIGNMSDMACAMELLGNFHNISERISKPVGQQEAIYETYSRHYKELIKIRNYIQAKNKKNDFERLFLKVQSDFLSVAKQASEEMKKLWQQMYAQDEGATAYRGIWCHGQFNQHNVVHTKQGLMIINFENLCYSTPMLDVTTFVRKMLEKSNWDTEVWTCMIKAYEIKRTLGEGEKELLFYLMKFPEKFWKISNHYYNSNKAWVSGRDIEKLERVIEQENRRRSFLEKAFSFEA